MNFNNTKEKIYKVNDYIGSKVSGGWFKNIILISFGVLLAKSFMQGNGNLIIYGLKEVFYVFGIGIGIGIFLILFLGKIIEIVNSIIRKIG